MFGVIGWPDFAKYRVGDISQEECVRVNLAGTEQILIFYLLVKVSVQIEKSDSLLAKMCMTYRNKLNKNDKHRIQGRRQCEFNLFYLVEFWSIVWFSPSL